MNTFRRNIEWIYIGHWILRRNFHKQSQIYLNSTNNIPFNLSTATAHSCNLIRQ